MSQVQAEVAVWEYQKLRIVTQTLECVRDVLCTLKGECKEHRLEWPKKTDETFEGVSRGVMDERAYDMLWTSSRYRADLEKQLPS